MKKVKVKVDLRVNCEEHLELEAEKGRTRQRRETAKQKDRIPRVQRQLAKDQSYIKMGIDPKTGQDL